MYESLENSMMHSQLYNVEKQKDRASANGTHK